MQQQFAVVPLSRRDAFLVPLDSRAAARSSLSEYSGLRAFPKRVVRQLLAAAWVLGLPELVLRSRAALPAGDDTLLGHLRDVLSERSLTFATGLRRVGSFYTPVLQLFRADGTPVAYAKIGWDRVTSAQVRAESDALALVAAAAPQTFHAPGLRYAGEWEGLELCVTAPLPSRSKRVPASELPPVRPLDELAALDGPMETAALREATWWRGLIAEAAALERQAPGLCDAMERLAADAVGVELRFGRWHGDWVAWNMARAPDGLYVWDWEYSRPHAPFGLDLLHFFFQDAFVRQGRPLLAAFADAGRLAAPGLTALGIDADTQTLLRLLHRLELRARSERAVQQGAEPDPGIRDVPISTLFSPSS
jgi:hypothetical protein